jgi:hypothetical protein
VCTYLKLAHFLYRDIQMYRYCLLHINIHVCKYIYIYLQVPEIQTYILRQITLFKKKPQSSMCFVFYTKSIFPSSLFSLQQPSLGSTFTSSILGDVTSQAKVLLRVGFTV